MKLRIFVIDDEPQIRIILTTYLESLGHEVLEAEEPFLCDVYRGCDCSAPYLCGDILFVDYSMPNMTGLELIESMQKRGCKGAPAHKFILTGDASVIDMAKVKEIGCNVLQKPIGLDQIKSIVESIEKLTPPDRKLNDLSGLPHK